MGHMNSANKYIMHARHCMAKAVQAQRAEEKRQWLLMANTWLEMVPERERMAAINRDTGQG
jgi:hypothetical protein